MKRYKMLCQGDALRMWRNYAGRTCQTNDARHGRINHHSTAFKARDPGQQFLTHDFLLFLRVHVG
jgi:hypothetical protein